MDYEIQTNLKVGEEINAGVRFVEFFEQELLAAIDAKTHNNQEKYKEKTNEYTK
jgi:hypothetical protein